MMNAAADPGGGSDVFATRSGVAPSFDFTRWMDAETLDAFRAATRRRRFTAGQTIYLQGDVGNELFRIEAGRVRLSYGRGDGREIVFLFFRPGDCFGDSSLVDHGGRPQTAQAITDVELAVLDKTAFDEMRQGHRSFDDALLKLLAAQMRAAAAQLADRSFDDLSARIVARLAMFADAFGTAMADEVRLDLRVSQAELALMVGASRQHVNRILRRLENEGSIRNEGGRLTIQRALIDRLPRFDVP